MIKLFKRKESIEPQSQIHHVLLVLLGKRGQWVSALDISLKIGCLNHTGRINELRHDYGLVITQENRFEKPRYPNGSKTRHSYYRLESDAELCSIVEKKLRNANV